MLVLRRLWEESAVGSFDWRARHVRGVDNGLADAASRDDVATLRKEYAEQGLRDRFGPLERVHVDPARVTALLKAVRRSYAAKARAVQQAAAPGLGA